MADHIEDGGPAFPFTERNDDGSYYHGSPGMSLRDAFAIAAMQGAFSSPLPSSQQEKEYIAMHAYRMADAMLKARRA